MKRKRVALSSFLNLLLFIFVGILKNGDRSVEAASLVQQALRIQRQIDPFFNLDRPTQDWLLKKHEYQPNTEYSEYFGMLDSRVPRVEDGDDHAVTAGNLQMFRKRRSSTRELYIQNHGRQGVNEYGVVVKLDEAIRNPNRSIDESMQRLKQAFSSVLQWPVDNIHVEKINMKGKVVELSFSRPDASSDLDEVEVPARDILTHANLLHDLQSAVPELRIHQIGPEQGIILAVYDSPFWIQPFFPYVVAGGSILIVLVLGIVAYACFVRVRDGAELSRASEVLGSQHLYQQSSPPQECVLYPDVTPDTGSPRAVQPCSAPLYVPLGFATTPVPAQPLRVKRKGLLESRRGSSASLTLDLQPSPEMSRWDGTPPKESTGLEFLATAGNRLSRRDLRNAAKNTKVLYEEFWEIPMNHPEKVSVAGSGMKNRYKTIIPNEHTRVVLPDAEQDPLSSYINANYIRGYEGEPRAYIATQGPMAHTIVDFWLMVWHEHSPIIVMITKLKEKSKPKCENYLPDQHGIYGDIEVTVVKVIQKKGYIVRHLNMKCGGESRPLLHFWYTAWPDHKPPDSPGMLLELVKEVELRRYKTDGVTPTGPVTVHCSAGIGRTGCFVAISIGIRQLREEHSVDILGIVCSMRMDRGGMIQTHEQYDFVHQALVEYEHFLGEPSIQSITALTSEGH